MRRRASQTLLLSVIVLALLIAPSSSVLAVAAAKGNVPEWSVVARVYYTDRADLARLAERLDIWEVRGDQRYMIAALTQSDWQRLAAEGYRLQIEIALTAELNRPRTYLPGQIDGIPGYPCYRTVEETFATATTIVAQHPTLAQWIDIGDSWEKVTPGGNAGYDLGVLRLTNANSAAPKAKFFAMSAIHAREYTPAELNTRFAEYLVNNYGADPDVTWLLDYNEIHLLLQANPDGRKWAEQNYSWRKNTNNNFCANTNSRGIDLNRNWPFGWGGPGASDVACNETFRGPGAASEPETQSTVAYVRSIFPDQRPDDRITPAPDTATGVFLDLHSYSQLVLWSWGDTYDAAPNGTQLQTLGRKFAYFNNYTPDQSVGLYPTSGTTDDTVYGELGVPAYTFELGTSFFQACSTFESTILPNNRPALVYAAKAARRPYQSPAGPDALNVTVTPTATTGLTATLTATANDTRFNSSNGSEPTQSIAAARYSIDAPSWITGTVTQPMTATDGAYNTSIENIVAVVNVSDLSEGRHTLFVEAQDANGNWGVPTAVFVQVGPVVSQGGLPLLMPDQQTG
ncbi:MAG: hypothetical protein HY870_11375, partial [Chloroflexi bacterium]|nr:hypothetical protein [Chloroflexota bacterium]